MRRSGILMHISSLPNDYGIGKLGKEAYAFVDFLEKAHQNVGRYFLYLLQAMVIRHIRAFLFTPEIHTL